MFNYINYNQNKLMILSTLYAKVFYKVYLSRGNFIRKISNQEKKDWDMIIC